MAKKTGGFEGRPENEAPASDGVVLGDTATVRVIRKSVDDSDYRWRTIAGLAKDSRLTAEVVLKVIEANPTIFLKSTKPSKSGKDLYTTRDTYAEQTGFIRKIADIITSSST